MLNASIPICNSLNILNCIPTISGVGSPLDLFSLSILMLSVGFVFRLVNNYSRVTLFHHPVTRKIKYRSPLDGNIKEMPLDQMLQITCPALCDAREGRFYPHLLLFNGHLQTIYATLYAKFLMKPKVKFNREILNTQDGGIISLDWTIKDRETVVKNGTTPYVLILHGLTGGSHESYIQDLIVELQQFDYNCVVMNFRGCADTKVLTPQLYSCSYTDDVNITVRHIMAKDPSAAIFGVGFSLGSNVITKYAGQLGTNCPLVGLASIGNPYDMLGGQRNLQRSLMGKFYLWGLGKNLKRFFFKFSLIKQTCRCIQRINLARYRFLEKS